MYIEIGFSKDDKIDVDKELKDTLYNLEKIGITKNNALKAYSTIIMDPAYVHINGETNDKINKYIENMEKQGVYTIGRYGAWTYCSMEDCMVEAKRIADTLKS